MSRSLLTVAATTGVLAAAAGYAQADSSADSSNSGSPGMLSGNTVEAPVGAPVNACGNSADVVGAMNPAFGNNCQNHSGGSARDTAPRPQAPASQAPAPQSEPSAAPAPQREPAREPAREPVREPVREPAPQAAPADRDSAHRAQGSQAAGNDGHAGQAEDAEMTRHASPEAVPAADAGARPALADTGSAGVGTAAALGAGVLVGGVVLYRRGSRGRA
ncbi:chaplin family protein [Streptomyces sp. NPDC048172]|uniref:chaplin n=1 Tax=Streptomyces sp. NPDC048172 TaxID=3365505 RepID=UPI0037150EE9